MKISISLFFTLLAILFSTATFAQTETPVSPTEYQEVVDTIITFDPVTYKEEMQIIRRKVKSDAPLNAPEGYVDGVKVQRDTIIYFDKDTYEERMVIVTRKGANNQDLAIPPLQANEATMQVDTIITFDPTTKKETIQIVRRKKN